MTTLETTTGAVDIEPGHDELIVSVVIPCLNEEENIEECVRTALGVLEREGIPGEVVVADNASEDRSAELATAAGARVVHEPRRGYGSAYMAGFGAARGAEMLSLMLSAGIVSRLVSGWISDHVGGLRTLLLGSVLQGVALLAFLFTDGITSLYLVSAMFGLFQGGIVPSYALIVREYFTPKEAGARVGTVLMATLFGMALGGWMSGAIFDLTGSYRAAFLNGTAWNLLNVGIVLLLLYRARGRHRVAGAVAA